MSDFITMTCPKCGGNLSISPNTSTLVCQFCGTEHMVRWQGGSVLLESFARCPQCNRNDRVQKISAILASQTNTILAQKLLPPPKPNSPAKPEQIKNKKVHGLVYNMVLYSIVGSLGAISIVIFIYNIGNMAPGEACLGPTGLILIIYALVNIANAPKAKLLEEEKIKEYGQAVENWKKLVIDHDKAMDNWPHLLKLWDRLYYCDRDDCVFMPGANTFAPSSIMVEYLRKLQDNKKVS